MLVLGQEELVKGGLLGAAGPHAASGESLELLQEGREGVVRRARVRRECVLGGSAGVRELGRQDSGKFFRRPLLGCCPGGSKERLLVFGQGALELGRLLGAERGSLA